MKSSKRSRGRPTASPGTIRIYYSGMARIAPDLAGWPYYRPQVSVEGRKLHIKLWGSEQSGIGAVKAIYARGARSPLVSLQTVLKTCGFKAGQAMGTYNAYKSTIKGHGYGPYPFIILTIPLSRLRSKLATT